MYESLAYVYDKLNYDIDYNKWVDDYDAILKPEGMKSVVEVACGTGQISWRLSKRGYQVTGIDLSGEMLQKTG